MTLQQLRYITTVADTGTITEAAKKLYISQPSLTNAIHELEKEMGLTVTVLPLIIAYLILSKYIVAGVALGGVKG